MIKGWLGNFILVAALLVGCVLTSLAQSPCEGLRMPVWTNGQFHFVLLAEPDVAYTIETSSNLLNWITALVSSNSQAVRNIQLGTSAEAGFYRAVRGPLPKFIGALVARQDIRLKGNNVWVDSFDSGDPAYSSNGFYHFTMRKAGGDVVSGFSFVEVGNANVNGKIKVGPTGSYTVGPSGFAGDLSWTGPGVQPGWFETNFSYCFPDVALPPNFAPLPPPAGPGTNLYILGSGDYMLSNLVMTSSQHILVVGNARLYVPGNITISGAIDISLGARLDLFAGGGTNVLAQVNTAGTARTFAYWGLPSNTSLTWQGNQSYVGTVYAPQASLTLSSGDDFQGACLANSLTVIASFRFHFDEFLLRAGPKR